jgi:hypothetical protein
MASRPEGLQPLYAEVVGPTRGELTDRSLGELRTMRLDCEQAEAAVSFTRRVLHGRLDLVATEEERRHEPRPAASPGGAPLADVLERLRTVLVAQHWPAPPRARRVVLTPAPDCVRDDLLQLIDDVAGPTVLTELGRQSDDRVAEVRGGLQRLERELSTLRRELHVAIDALHGEVSRRCRQGETSLDRLLE